MPSQGQVTLRLLHDLALLCLNLAHGTDNDLHPSEKRQVASVMRNWQPNKDPALIEHVLREAMLTYLNDSHSDRLNAAVSALRDALPRDVRASILDDLLRIARADGKVLSEERDFIQSLARAWDLDLQKG